MGYGSKESWERPKEYERLQVPSHYEIVTFAYYAETHSPRPRSVETGLEMILLRPLKRWKKRVGSHVTERAVRGSTKNSVSAMECPAVKIYGHKLTPTLAYVTMQRLACKQAVRARRKCSTSEPPWQPLP